MQQAQATKNASPVPRSMTLAGGFKVKTEGMPALQSGQSGSRVIADKAEDPKSEAKTEVLALIARLAELAQDIDDGRFIQADDSLRAARRQVDNIAGYVQHLAREQAVPFTCPRCLAAKTHDASGKCFCDACVNASYGRVRL
jgi:hypothetical protein